MRLRFASIFMAICLLAQTYVSFCRGGVTSPVSKVTSTLRRATNYYYRGRYNKAIAEFKKIIAKDPNCVVAYERLAGAYEAKGKFDLALQQWERIIDTAKSSFAERRKASFHLKRLYPKVPPNQDASKANSWNIYVLFFRHLDMDWKDKEGKMHHAKATFTEEELKILQEGFINFTKLVFEYSRGNLRIDYKVKIVDEPIASASGEGPFWLGPWNIMNQIKDLYQPGEMDSLFVYAKFGSRKDPDSLPPAMLGGTYGADYGYNGAGFTAYTFFSDWIKSPMSGELELHEWLHQIDWAMSNCLGYPDELVPTSDGGRDMGYSGSEPWVDPCYRRPKEEKTWLPFYKHIMQEHITSKMWQEVKMNKHPPGYLVNWLLCGPFSYQEDKDDGISIDYISEIRVLPSAGTLSGDKSWKEHHSTLIFVNLEPIFTPNEFVVAYAHLYIKSPKRQKANLYLGSDDGLKVWLNGSLVLEKHLHRAYKKDEDKAEIELVKGWNRFLLKVEQVTGGWGYSVKLADLSEKEIKGLRYQLNKPVNLAP